MKIKLEFDVPEGVEPSAAEEALREIIDVGEVQAALNEWFHETAVGLGF